MFKNIDLDTAVSSTSALKSSVQRGILSRIREQYPTLDPAVLEQVLLLSPSCQRAPR